MTGRAGRATRPALLGAALGALAPGIAVAAPLPVTALSESQQVPSELLDDEANQYLFPQLAAPAPSTVFAFGAEFDVDGSGLRAHFTERAAFSFLSLRAVPSHTAYRETPPVYQLGWAARLAALRLGLSYAWSSQGDRGRETDFFGDILRRQSDFLTLGHHQASFGLGWGDSAASVDLVAEVAWERLDSRWSDQQSSPGAENPRQLREVHLKLEGDALPGVALRIRAPLSSGLRWIAFGSWRETSHDFFEEERNEFETPGNVVVEMTTVEEHDHGQEWTTGLRVELGETWRCGVHGYWESHRPTWRYRPGRGEWQRERETSEALQLGVSATFPLGRRTIVRSGFSMTGRRTDWRRGVSATDLTRVEGSESVAKEFGWGATHAFHGLEVTGSVRSDLSLIRDLFLRVDLYARF